MTISSSGPASGGALRSVSGDNTYGGLITLAATSRINADAGSTLLLDVASGNAISGGQNIVFGGAGQITVADPIATGGGTLTKDGAGTLILSAANTFTGSTTINDGILRLTNSSALGTSAGGVRVVGNSSNDGILELAGDITIAGETLTVEARQVGTINVPHLRNLSGNNEWAGPITLTTGGSTYTFESQSGLLTISGTISAGSLAPTRILQFTGSSDGIVTSNILNSLDAGGVPQLTKSGTGTWTLSGNNTYRGPTLINSGTLQIGNGGTSGALSPSSAITNNGTLQFNQTDTVTQGTDFATAAIAGTGKMVQNGSGTLVLNAANTYSGSTSINSGTIQIASDANLGTAPGAFTANQLVLDGGTLQTTGAVTLANNRGVTIGANDGTFTLGGPMTYLGRFTGAGNTLSVGGSDFILQNSTGTPSNVDFNVLSNRLFFSSNNALGTGAVTVNSGARLVNNSGSSASAVSNTVDLLSGGGLSARVATTFSGINLPTAGSIILNNDDQPTNTLTITNGVALSGDLTVQTGGTNTTVGTSTLSGTISGSGGITKTQVGTLVLSGNNSYDGVTTVSAGILSVTNANALGTALGNTVVANGAQLILNPGANTTFNEPLSVAGQGPVANNSGVLRNIAGDNIYAGAITLNAGGVTRIQATNSGSLTISGGITGVPGAQLALSGGRDITIDTTPISIPGAFYAHGGGNIYLNVAGNTLPDVRVQYNTTLAIGVDDAIPTTADVTIGSTAVGTGPRSGTLDLNGHNQTIDGLSSGNAGGVDQPDGNRTVTNSGGAAVTLTVGNNNGTTRFDGTIQDGTGTIALTKVGTGTQTLSGTNTYTGDTTVTAGTLALTGGSAIADSGAVIVNGGTLRLDSSETIGSLAGTGGAVNIQGNTLTTGGNGDTTTYDGALSGTGGLVKAGSGTMTLANASGFLGGNYDVTGGTLAVANANMGTPSSIHIANGSTFDTLATQFAPSAPVTVSGTGTLATGGAGIAWNSFVTLSPGNSPGQLNVGGNVDWSGAVGAGGTYNWQVYDANGGAGGLAGYDLINITGSLDMTGGSGTINGIGLSGLPNVAGLPLNVDMEPGAQTLFEIIRTSAGVIGFGSFSPTFVNSMNHKGFFKLLLSGNSVYLLWEATPEPGTWVLFGLLGFAVAFGVRRRRLANV